MSSFTTAVIGASPNPSRYAFLAVNRLVHFNFDVVALGFREGNIGNIPIQREWPEDIPNLKVVSLYLGPQRQEPFYDYIIGLQPEKVIFNPGTENPELYDLLTKAGIQFEKACTLVLLNTGVYKEL